MTRNELYIMLKRFSKRELEAIATYVGIMSNDLYFFERVAPEDGTASELALVLLSHCERRKWLDYLRLAIRMVETQSDCPFQVGDIVIDLRHRGNQDEIQVVKTASGNLVHGTIRAVPVAENAVLDETSGQWRRYVLR